jgi:hypothetical protein
VKSYAFYNSLRTPVPPPVLVSASRDNSRIHIKIPCRLPLSVMTRGVWRCYAPRSVEFVGLLRLNPGQGYKSSVTVIAHGFALRCPHINLWRPTDVAALIRRIG